MAQVSPSCQVLASLTTFDQELECEAHVVLQIKVPSSSRSRSKSRGTYVAQTLASWPHTCSGSGITRPMPAWAALWSGPALTGRCGGPAAGASQAISTGGRPQ